MPPSPLALLATRRFAPLFLSQFLGAFNDNLFKNAIVVLILFRIAPESGLPGPVLVTARVIEAAARWATFPEAAATEAARAETTAAAGVRVKAPAAIAAAA